MRSFEFGAVISTTAPLKVDLKHYRSALPIRPDMALVDRALFHACYQRVEGEDGPTFRALVPRIYDYSGLRTKKGIPVLAAHTGRPIGWAAVAPDGPLLRASGELVCDTNEGTFVARCVRAGLRLGASIGAPGVPTIGDAELIPEGASVVVNRVELVGPLKVVRRWRLDEFSVCVEPHDTATWVRADCTADDREVTHAAITDSPAFRDDTGTFWAVAWDAVAVRIGSLLGCAYVDCSDPTHFKEILADTGSMTRYLFLAAVDTAGRRAIATRGIEDFRQLITQPATIATARNALKVALDCRQISVKCERDRIDAFLFGRDILSC